MGKTELSDIARHNECSWSPSEQMPSLATASVLSRLASRSQLAIASVFSPPSEWLRC